MKISSYKKVFGQNSNSPKLKLTVVLVDDEKMVRSSLIRLLDLHFKNKNIEVTQIECCDGLEMLAVVYNAFLKNIQIDLIISDENMRFISGSYSSQVLYSLFEQQIIGNIPMYINTAIGNNDDLYKYSKMVRKVYSKPIDSKSIVNILSEFNK